MLRRVAAIAICGLLLHAGLAGGPAAFAAPPGRPAAAQAETRNALLLLDSGPLHLCFHLTLEGRSLTAVREEYVARLFEKLDTDNDGKLSPGEADRSPLLVKKSRPRAEKFLASLGAPQTVSKSNIRRTVQRVAGETVVYRQDESSAETDLEVFNVLDADSSGILDRTEIATAGERILQKDQDRDECISYREFIPPPAEPAQAQLLQQQNRREIPQAKQADRLMDLGGPLLVRRVIRRMLQMYDRNRDRRLSGEELGWEDTRVRLLDGNGDRLLDESELHNVKNTSVDLELAVELTGSRNGEPALKVISTRGVRKDGARRPDYVRIALADSILTVSFRIVEPIPEAIENAMQRFNALDGDANGYLDREETADVIRFEHGLFETIDFDGDGKIFAGEMKEFVTARGEPEASTGRVHVYDTGRGFFQTLDRNGDGRISIREIRTAHESLANMQRDNQRGLSSGEPTRHFHLEFVRGSYRLFGRADQMISMAPRFERFIPVGPVWFQRMDRNSDGDLTWNEFLGPRDVYLRLDADRDNLLDYKEAEKAEQENPASKGEAPAEP